MVVLKEANVFLVYVESTRKNKMRSKISNLPGNPIFAEDILLHNRFLLDEELPRHWYNYRPKFLAFLLVANWAPAPGQVLLEILPEPKGDCSDSNKRT